jgi:Bacterial protein of unknown function (DUF937)
MSINLLKLMQDAIGSQVSGPVAKLIGVDEALVKKAIGAAIPTLLAGFIGKASTEQGANQLGTVLDQADGRILDNIGAILGGADGGSAKLLEMGKGLLSGLLGDKAGGIVDLLGNVSGLGKEKSGSLLGMVAPILFSLLGKQKKTMGMDAAGFAKVLLSQKDFLKGVLPPGVGNLLGIGGLDAGQAVGAAASNLKGAAASVTQKAAAPVVAAKSSGGGFMKMLLPLLILALIGFAVWKYVLPKMSGASASMASVTPDNAVSTLNGIISDVTSTIGGISDVPSANAALPKIDSLASRINEFQKVVKGLPEPVRNQLVNAVRSFAPKFSELLEKAYAIPGVKAILEPKVSSLLDKLEAFIS